MILNTGWAQCAHTVDPCNKAARGINALAVVDCIFDIEVSVRGGTPAPAIIEEVHLDLVGAGRPVTLQRQRVVLARAVQRRGNEGAADLHPIHLVGVLGTALPGFLTQLQDEAVGPGPGRETGSQISSIRRILSLGRRHKGEVFVSVLRHPEPLELFVTESFVARPHFAKARILYCSFLI